MDTIWQERGHSTAFFKVLHRLTTAPSLRASWTAAAGRCWWLRLRAMRKEGGGGVWRLSPNRKIWAKQEYPDKVPHRGDYVSFGIPDHVVCG